MNKKFLFAFCILISNCSLLAQLFPISNEICSSVGICFQGPSRLMVNDQVVEFTIKDPNQFLKKGYRIFPLRAEIINNELKVTVDSLFEMNNGKIRLPLKSGVTLFMVVDNENVSHIVPIPSFERGEPIGLFYRGIPFKPSDGIPRSTDQIDVAILSERSFANCDMITLKNYSITYQDRTGKALSTVAHNTGNSMIKLSIPYGATNVIIQLESMVCQSGDGSTRMFNYQHKFIQIPVVENNPLLELARLKR